MTKSLVVGFIAFIVSVGLFAASTRTHYSDVTTRDGERVLEVRIEYPDVQFEKDSSGRYIATIEGLPRTLDGGLPSLPVQTVPIALPHGYVLSKGELVEGAHQFFDFAISRNSAVHPMSWRTRKDIPRGYRRAVAPSIETEAYPESRFTLSSQKWHGVTVVLANVFPLQVGRDGRGIDSVRSMTLRLHLTPSIGSQSLQAHQAAQIAQTVINPETVSRYELVSQRSKEAYEYLIIATPSIAAFDGDNDLKDLQAGLLERNLRSKVVTTLEIDATATGPALADKIREFIQKEYRESAIQYVLLAGDSRTSASPNIPSRKLWSKVRAYMFGTWMDIEEQIPADLYYANLDGPFNGNGNANWGEPTDGPGGADVDFLPEVTVGRVPLRSTQDLQNFVKKTLAVYARPLPAKALLMGEELFKELGLYGGEYMDQLVGGSSDHGFVTKGMPASWAVEKFYDTADGKSWSGSQAIQSISTAGFGMVHHLGHSNNSTNMKISTSQVASFKNETPFLYYTQGCFAGDFVKGSIVDRMVAASNGAVVAVANTSYGLAPEDPTPTLTKTPGASQMFHRQFVHAFIDKGVRALGVAHQASKVALVGQKSAQEVRWVNWAASYLGDPSLAVSP